MAMSDLDRSRRFARRRTRRAAVPDDSLAELHAELVLLREENARLKAAEHAEPDIEACCGRARSLVGGLDRQRRAPQTSDRVLVEGLAIRESLLEICPQIERVDGRVRKAAARTRRRRRPEPELQPAAGRPGRAIGSSRPASGSTMAHGWRA